jgi:hypothetical protein
MPNLEYWQKWFFIEGIPLAIFTIFALVASVNFVVVKTCCRKSHVNTRSEDRMQWSIYMGMCLGLFYYLYLYITRTALTIFQCSPTDPPEPDGSEYMEAVFIQCWKDPQHQLLVPFALVAIAVYGLAYPILVFFLLYRNRDTIRHDQLLRALQTGDNRSTGQHTFFFRRKYATLYYRFKPKVYFWVLVILGRKLLLSFTALMFRKTPGFQLAMALLVVFTAYALQVKHSPYMSPSEREKVLQWHENLARHGSELHGKLATELSRARKALARDSRSRKRKRVEVTAYFVNYNSVEMVLLASAFLICLAGVMFESKKFNDTGNEAQVEALTWLVIIIVAVR